MVITCDVTGKQLKVLATNLKDQIQTKSLITYRGVQLKYAWLTILGPDTTTQICLVDHPQAILLKNDWLTILGTYYSKMPGW